MNISVVHSLKSFRAIEWSLVNTLCSKMDHFALLFADNHFTGISEKFLGDDCVVNYISNNLKNYEMYRFVVLF